MNTQESVEYQMRMRPIWLGDTSWSDWEKCSRDSFNDYIKTPKLHDWEYEVRELYATPQPCPTCQALARTVMMDQTGRDL